MKTLLTFLCATMLWAAQNSENYYIIQLKGGILNKTTGKALKIGDQINHDDQLKFLSSDAGAILMSTKRGRFVVKPATHHATENELTVFVKNVLLPVKSSGNLSTRGEEADGIMDLKNFLGTEKFAIIGDRVALHLNAAKYPVSDMHFFIYRYEHDGKAVSKKVPFENGKIIFDKNLLYQTYGGLIAAETVKTVDIYYHNAATKNSTAIVKFSPVYLPEDEIKQELKVQIDIFKAQNLGKEEIKKELHGYIRDVYGKTDVDVLDKLIAGLEN